MILATLILSALFIHQPAQSAEALKISPASGKPPLKVEIKAPTKLIAMSKNTFSKWGGCRYSIDWGDGEVGPNFRSKDCSKGFEHVYSKPGVYRVTARIIQMTPNDDAITTWNGEASISVR